MLAVILLGVFVFSVQAAIDSGYDCTVFTHDSGCTVAATVRDKYFGAEWAGLPDDARNAMIDLGFDEEKWGEKEFPSVFWKSFDRLNTVEEAAVLALGYTSDGWDARQPGSCCGICSALIDPDECEASLSMQGGEWLSFDEDTKQLWTTLGWDARTFTDREDKPGSASRTWAQLADFEREAATSLGFESDTWNGLVPGSCCTAPGDCEEEASYYIADGWAHKNKGVPKDKEYFEDQKYYKFKGNEEAAKEAAKEACKDNCDEEEAGSDAALYPAGIESPNGKSAEEQAADVAEEQENQAPCPDCDEEEAVEEEEEETNTPRFSDGDDAPAPVLVEKAPSKLDKLQATIAEKNIESEPAQSTIDNLKAKQA